MFFEHCELLKAYKEEHGDAIVNTKYVTESGFRLGAWVNNQRSKYKTGKLSQDEMALLEDAGMIWGPMRACWDSMYEKARNYLKEHGSFEGMYTNAAGEEYKQLGAWLRLQRNCYLYPEIYGNRALNPVERIKIERLGIIEKSGDNEEFEKGISELKKYKAENKELLIPIEFVTESGYRLGKWCSRQRNLYRKQELLDSRRRRLNRMGFIWDYTEHYWNTMYKHAEDYYEAHDNLKVPSSYVCTDGAKLGQWISCMRKRKKRLEKGIEEITTEQVYKLEAIGMLW